MRCLILCGTVVPLSFLIDRVFDLPTGGFFGLILPAFAAATFLLLLVFLFVTREDHS